MHLDDSVTLLIFAAGAFLVPLVVGRVGLPAAVGEILYGIAVGPSVLGLVHPEAFSTFLAEIGFAFLMFLAGLELDFPHIERTGLRTLGLGVVTAVVIFAAALGATLALELPLFLSLVFAAMSAGILLVTLTEAGLTKSPLGQLTILVGSVGELLTIVVLTAFSFYHTLGLGWPLAIEMSKLGVIFVVAYVLLVVLRTLIWWRPHSFARVVAARDPSEIGVRAGMTLMLVFVALAALLGIEPILGAFVAGALFSFVFRAKGILEEKLSSIGFGFFVPIFFIWVGTEFDLSAVLNWGALTTLALLFGVSVLCKLTSSFLLLGAGLRLREVVGAGMLLAAPLTLLVAIANIGLDLKLLDQTTSSAIVLLSLVTAVVMPPLFRLMVGVRIQTSSSPRFITQA